MSFLNIIRKGVAIADKQTKSLQAYVTYERSQSQDMYGKRTFAAPVQLRALVDWKQKQLRTTSGILTVSRASITLLDIKAVVAATNGQGIDDNDRFTLPDGTTGPIIDMSGFIDAGTGHPFCTEVFLG